MKKSIADLLESNPDYDDGSYGPLLVRLAWHSSGTYDKNTGRGGSNGATMRCAWRYPGPPARPPPGRLFSQGSLKLHARRPAWTAGVPRRLQSTASGCTRILARRFSPEAGWGANAGLAVARDLLEPVKRRYP